MPANPTLNLSFVRSTDRTYITVTDLTGVGSLSNPGGYGGVNAAVGDYYTFSISVTAPDPDTLLPTGTPVVIDAYPSLPSQTSGTFDLTSLLVLGVADTTLVDGVWLFQVSANWLDGFGVTGTTTYSAYVYFFDIVRCCIDNMVVEAVGCGCAEDSPKMKSLAKAIVYIYALSGKEVNGVMTDAPLIDCEQWSKAATAILALQDICDNENCGGCNGCN